MMMMMMNNVMMILLKGGDVKIKTKEGMTPFILAASKGYLETVDYLFGNGDVISQTDNNQRNAIHWAVKNAHLEVLSFLLQVIKMNTDSFKICIQNVPDINITNFRKVALSSWRQLMIKNRQSCIMQQN